MSGSQEGNKWQSIAAMIQEPEASKKVASKWASLCKEVKVLKQASSELEDQESAQPVEPSNDLSNDSMGAPSLSGEEEESENDIEEILGIEPPTKKRKGGRKKTHLPEELVERIWKLIEEENGSITRLVPPLHTDSPPSADSLEEERHAIEQRDIEVAQKMKDAVAPIQAQKKQYMKAIKSCEETNTLQREVLRLMQKNEEKKGKEMDLRVKLLQILLGVAEDPEDPDDLADD